MVTSVMGLSRSGVTDFVIQRVTAIIIAAYMFCVLGFFVVNAEVTHADLVAWFSGPIMRIFTTLAVLSTAAHAWIGMWTVGTDYIREHYFGAHATVFRFIYLLGSILVLFVYVLWALMIFWGI